MRGYVFWAGTTCAGLALKLTGMFPFTRIRIVHMPVVGGRMGEVKPTVLLRLGLQAADGSGYRKIACATV